MAQIPRILKNFSLFVDGRGLAGTIDTLTLPTLDRKSTRLNSSHVSESRMPSSA